MKATHTPGPWKVIDGIGCGSIYSIKQETPSHNNGVLAAVLHAPDAKAPLMVAQANARLIAAAPELLAALYKIAEWDPASAPGEPNGMSVIDAIDIARAAIAKARGQ